MNEFGQLYWQYLEVLAAAQDRCEATVSALIHATDNGIALSDDLLTEYADSHEALQTIVASFPRLNTRNMRLASTAG